MEGLIAGWPMIAANVPTFVVIVALIAGSLWAAFNWSYGRVIATKDGQIELQDRQLADYRKQLEGATPDQARAKIEEPEDQVRDTVSDAATKVAAPPKGDIDSRLAFFRILESSRWRQDQERETKDTRNLVHDWLEVRLRSEIHKALRNSLLASWGEECLPGTATTPEKPIPPETWDKVEILFDRNSAPRTGAHFKGSTSRELGRMAWVAVRFSSDQIFEMFPLTSPSTNAWKPVCIAIQHISERTGDSEANNCFERTRLALRQAACDKRVRFRAKKQMTEPSPFAGRREHSDIYTDVDSGYWANSNINALATSRDMQTSHHSDPQTAYAWGKLGIDERNRVYDLQVNWNDVVNEWP